MRRADRQGGMDTRVLCRADVVPYLVRRGLLEASASAQASIEDCSRRNRTFKVRMGRRGGWLLKQANRPSDLAWRSVVVKEGRLVAALRAEKRLRPFLVPVRLIDARRGVVVSALLDPCTSMTKYHLSGGKVRFGAEGGAILGTLLAAVHATPAPPSVPRREPLAWDPLARIERMGPDASASLLELADMLRTRPGLGDALERARAHGGAHDTLLHGDARWDNVLPVAGTPRQTPLNARVIDWEMATRGDPAWDLACALSEYVRFWFHPLRGVRVRSLAHAKALAPFTFREFHRSARALWRSYAVGTAQRRHEGAELLDRTMEHLPLALVALAWEDAATQHELPGTALAALQMAVGVHERLAACSEALFGLRLREVARARPLV
jgi:aminoglycoside phosphotransferase (APT) family kinase protein